jgi:hypothetical protein
VADFLNGNVYSTDAAVAGLGWSFTIDLAAQQKYGSTIDLEDCAIEFKIYRLADTRSLAPTTDAPLLTLTLGNGLERATNEPALQEGTLVITPVQSQGLLEDDTYRFFAYQWRVLIDGGETIAAPVGGDFEGQFGLAKPGWIQAALARLRV